MTAARRSRHLVPGVLALAALLLLSWYFGRPGEKTSGGTLPSTGTGAAPLAPGQAPPGARGARSGAGSDSESDGITADLNAPGGTIQRDLTILEAVFEQWTTNFPAMGNPVGTNAEITAALTGANLLGLEVVPPGHRAISPRGELRDRWDTPFRFHQWSGTAMEVISAGPDKRFATPDDVSSGTGYESQP